MNNEFFSKRLQQALNFNRMKPIELANKTGIGKSSISYYLSGNYKASQKHLEKIAKALGVNEAWLLGYSDETTLKPIFTSFDELEELFKRYKNLLTNDDRDTIKFIIEKRIKENEK
jgi:transcriptional regulator with XRE-family HTH domain